jgi:hypothetical protein
MLLSVVDWAAMTFPASVHAHSITTVSNVLAHSFVTATIAAGTLAVAVKVIGALDRDIEAGHRIILRGHVGVEPKSRRKEHGYGDRSHAGLPPVTRAVTPSL